MRNETSLPTTVGDFAGETQDKNDLTYSADAAHEASETEVDTELDGGVDTGADTAPNAAENETDFDERRRCYDEFIEAHKDLYTEDTQRIISKRFKDYKKTVEKLNAANAELERLRLELDASRAVPCEPDDDFLASHPQFSLERELESTVFSCLYRGGIDIGTAYDAAHIGELLHSTREVALREAADATIQSIRARGTRTREGATVSGGGSLLKQSASALSRSERADIARRVMAGERFDFI